MWAWANGFSELASLSVKHRSGHHSLGLLWAPGEITCGYARAQGKHSALIFLKKQFTNLPEFCTLQPGARMSTRPNVCKIKLGQALPFLLFCRCGGRLQQTPEKRQVHLKEEWNEGMACPRDRIRADPAALPPEHPSTPRHES